jgi:dephospho-CoA kinase
VHVIGLLGGVASGKSWVAAQLAQMGAGVLDADRAGHEVLRRTDVEQAARSRWGDSIFTPAGHIDRARLARIVFSQEPRAIAERTFLQQLTHPEIGEVLARQADKFRAAGCRAAVLDAPLLLEAGWDKLCDVLLLVDAPRNVRLARAEARGWSHSDFSAREDAQESLDLKRSRADVIIDNSGSAAQTRAQVEHFWRTFVG